MDIIGIDTAVFGVDELDAARRFCRDYGLNETEHGASGAGFEALDGSSVILRLSSDKSLPPAKVSGSTSRQTIWGVRDKQALEKIGAELSKDRDVRRDAAGVLHSVDDDGLAIAFEVSKRRAYDTKPALQNVPGFKPQRPINSRVDFIAPPKARSLGHIVFWSRDPDRSISFYVNRLGFRITDHVKNNVGVFARAAGSPDHHNVFFFGHPKNPTSFQHLECHFADFQEVMIGGSILHERGWKTVMGPGRHILGSNYYWYFDTPLGGAFEVSADIDQLDDGWVAGEWENLAEVAGWAVNFVRMEAPGFREGPATFDVAAMLNETKS